METFSKKLFLWISSFSISRYVCMYISLETIMQAMRGWIKLTSLGLILFWSFFSKSYKFYVNITINIYVYNVWTNDHA